MLLQHDVGKDRSFTDNLQIIYTLLFHSSFGLQSRALDLVKAFLECSPWVPKKLTSSMKDANSARA